MKQIVENAGLNGPIVLEQIKRHSDPFYGFDVITGQYKNLIENGILDSVQTTTCALAHAVRAACVLLTTEKIVHVNKF